MSDEKPLFIPLIRKYYDDFKSGVKTHEMRIYGDRWNEKFCRPGRAVTLSMGYGKAHRLHGTVKEFYKVAWSDTSLGDRMALRDCYGIDVVGKAIAYIFIDLTQTPKEKINL